MHCHHPLVLHHSLVTQRYDDKFVSLSLKLNLPLLLGGSGLRSTEKPKPRLWLKAKAKADAEVRGYRSDDGLLVCTQILHSHLGYGNFLRGDGTRSGSVPILLFFIIHTSPKAAETAKSNEAAEVVRQARREAEEKVRADAEAVRGRRDHCEFCSSERLHPNCHCSSTILTRKGY